MLSNAYFLAKFRFDTAENEPAKNLQNFAKFSQPADEAVDAALRRRAREGLAHRAEVGPEPSLLHLRFNTFPTNMNHC